MAGSIAAAVAGSVISGAFSSKASKGAQKSADRAAELEAQAAREALDFQKSVYADSRADSAPYRAIGAPALSRLASSYGLKASPQTVEMEQQPDGSWAPAPTGVKTTQPVGAAVPIAPGTLPGAQQGSDLPILHGSGGEGAPTQTADGSYVTGDGRRYYVVNGRAQFVGGSGLNPNNQAPMGPAGPAAAAPQPPRRTDTIPGFVDDGTDPLDASQQQVSRIAAGFKTSPGYEFRQKEGENRLLQSSRARGLALSGGALKEVQRFGEGLAADEFGSFMSRGLAAFGDYNNRLASLAGVGQSAVNAGTAAGQNFANSASNIVQSGANNQANAMLAGGAIGAANTANIGRGFQTALDNYQFSRLLQGGPGGGGVTGTVVPWRNPDTGATVYPTAWS